MDKNTTSSVLVVNFGGQYAPLIARRVRECGIFCEVCSADGLRLGNTPSAIILSGGPQSVYAKNAVKLSRDMLPKGVPVLGICYGAQLIADMFGGRVSASPLPEYGIANATFNNSRLFSGVENSVVWMSHSDYISAVPQGFKVTSQTDSCACASMENPSLGVYAVQFHPEVTNTVHGTSIIKNFLYGVCGLKPSWEMSGFIQNKIADIKAEVGNRRVVLGLSGGVDSSVCASLISRAVGKNLTCIFVDHGLMRKNEGNEIEKVFGSMDLNFVRVNAEKRFLTALRGVKEPERKRKIVGSEFVSVFKEEAAKVNAQVLAQGTIYPDIIESGCNGGAVIKSHHNVGGLPKDIGFAGIVEPIKSLFKDEVKSVGTLLGLPNSLVLRQPFPGPGLAVRVVGEVTARKLNMLREADAIFAEVLQEYSVFANQFFAVLTADRSVGVMGDGRSYGRTVALRAVITSDFMTADFARIPYEALERASSRIVNEVKGINRVMYDITSKPPATIEWE